MIASEPARILIVDDETNIRLMLRTALRSEGYIIEEAADGRAGLSAIERRSMDVMILDLSMPVLDGIGVLEAIKNVRPNRKPRVIVLTAYGSISAAVKATRLGAIDFLEKPVSPDEVRESVAAALAEPMPAVIDTQPGDGGYEAVLDRIRKSLRLSRYADAEALFMRAADLSHHDPAYLNLLGVLYESRREWRLARKLYARAIDLDARCEPARKNLARLRELRTFGRSHEPVTLGDEADLLYARMPQTSEVAQHQPHG